MLALEKLEKTYAFLHLWYVEIKTFSSSDEGRYQYYKGQQTMIIFWLYKEEYINKTFIELSILLGVLKIRDLYVSIEEQKWQFTDEIIK